MGRPARTSRRTAPPRVRPRTSAAPTPPARRSGRRRNRSAQPPAVPVITRSVLRCTEGTLSVCFATRSCSHSGTLIHMGDDPDSPAPRGRCDQGRMGDIPDVHHATDSVPSTSWNAPSDVVDAEPAVPNDQPAASSADRGEEPSDRVLLGVAGHIADLLGLDALWVRLAFVVLALTGGVGIVIYLASWLVLFGPDRTGLDWVALRRRRHRVDRCAAHDRRRRPRLLRRTRRRRGTPDRTHARALAATQRLGPATARATATSPTARPRVGVDDRGTDRRRRRRSRARRLAARRVCSRCSSRNADRPVPADRVGSPRYSGARRSGSP